MAVLENKTLGLAAYFVHYVDDILRVLEERAHENPIWSVANGRTELANFINSISSKIT